VKDTSKPFKVGVPRSRKDRRKHKPASSWTPSKIYIDQDTLDPMQDLASQWASRMPP